LRRGRATVHNGFAAEVTRPARANDARARDGRDRASLQRSLRGGLDHLHPIDRLPYASRRCARGVGNTREGAARTQRVAPVRSHSTAPPRCEDDIRIEKADNSRVIRDATESRIR
jgi:hypothetical protein